MTIQQYKDKVLRLIDNINEFHISAAEQVAISSLSLVKNRIQTQGLEGEVYSNAYANSSKFKRKGKNKNRVDLTDTARMMKEIQVTEVLIKNGKIVVRAGVRSAKYFKYNQERYGNFLTLNAEEKEILGNSFRKIYEREFRLK